MNDLRLDSDKIFKEGITLMDEGDVDNGAYILRIAANQGHSLALCKLCNYYLDSASKDTDAYCISQVIHYLADLNCFHYGKQVEVMLNKIKMQVEKQKIDSDLLSRVALSEIEYQKKKFDLGVINNSTYMNYVNFLKQFVI